VICSYIGNARATSAKGSRNLKPAVDYFIFIHKSVSHFLGLPQMRQTVLN
jgi:hypothetical protein